MIESNGTGVTYPEIELGGKTYVLKFTRGTLYRLDKAGIVFNPRFTNLGKPNQQVTMPLAMFIDSLKIVIGFEGDPEELTELVFDRQGEIMDLMLDAWGKAVLPSLNIRIAALTAAKQAAATAALEPKPN